jgi:hypothetical protein
MHCHPQKSGRRYSSTVRTGCYRADGRSEICSAYARARAGSVSAMPSSCKMGSASDPGRCGGLPRRIGVADRLTESPGMVTAPTSSTVCVTLRPCDRTHESTMNSATGTTACALTPGHQQFNACTVYTERARRISVAVLKSNVERNRSRKFTPRTPSIRSWGEKVVTRTSSAWTMIPSTCRLWRRKLDTSAVTSGHWLWNVSPSDGADRTLTSARSLA